METPKKIPKGCGKPGVCCFVDAKGKVHCKDYTAARLRYMCGSKNQDGTLLCRDCATPEGIVW